MGADYSTSPYCGHLARTFEASDAGPSQRLGLCRMDPWLIQAVIPVASAQGPSAEGLTHFHWLSALFQLWGGTDSGAASPSG